MLADNSVVVSGMLWSGPPSRVIEAARSSHLQLLTSAELLTELRNALDRLTARVLNRGWPGAEAVIAEFQSIAELVVRAEVSAPALRDVADTHVLAAAVGGGANLVATSDRDLLVLREFQGIGIVTPVELLHTLGLD